MDLNKASRTLLQPNTLGITDFAFAKPKTNGPAARCSQELNTSSDPKYKDVQINIEIGDPGYRIAEFAKGIRANLIVIPSHGRTGLAHMLLGSVAERVLRMSHYPVLVLRD